MRGIPSQQDALLPPLLGDQPMKAIYGAALDLELSKLAPGR